MNPLIIVVALILIAAFLWSLYNGLIAKRLRVVEALSQIEVQLRRRADLVPNLVEIVKGYAKHEKTAFAEVTKARSALVSAGNLHDKAKANNMLTDALKSVFAVAEAYPDLKASENFKALQEEVTDTEDKIAYSRQFYNNVVMEFNTAIKVFPNFLFANLLNFKPAEFFDGELTDAEKKAPKISLS
jgi:LemA protein